ncbi:MAG: type II toxin-antitoxin system prevent-host-death family antitoxin [Puniceicoccaceae bacterium]|nr:MAG: type II toxin-antitoxin system prevent-host-death family antitoxin [Puniceicoccaceae bacterium]
MIINVRESKARLSELVSKANAGEDVVITVRGKPRARIVPVQSEHTTPDMSRWAEELKARLEVDVSTLPDSSNEIIDQLRGERW